MNSPTLYGQIQSFSCDSFNMADLHYATLPGSTESYSERTETRTFENHANLLTYLAN